MSEDGDPSSWPEPPNLLNRGSEGEVDDPLYWASSVLNLMRTMRILDRDEPAEEALEGLREGSSEPGAAENARIARGAFAIVDCHVRRILPNAWWTGAKETAHLRRGLPDDLLRTEVERLLEESVANPEGLRTGLRALLDDRNRTVEEAMSLLRGIFEELPRIAETIEKIGGEIYPDPSAPGGARVRRPRKPGTDPHVVAECVRSVLLLPRIAELSAPDWDGLKPFPYPSIRNTAEVRKAISDVLTRYPWRFDPSDVNPRARGPLCQILDQVKG